jgi:hypothetical protein
MMEINRTKGSKTSMMGVSRGVYKAYIVGMDRGINVGSIIDTERGLF